MYNSSIPISSTVNNFNKVIKINFWAFVSKLLHCINYFISFSKKIINYLHHKDIFRKKTWVDEMGVDEMGVDELGVDEMGVEKWEIDEVGRHRIIYLHSEKSKLLLPDRWPQDRQLSSPCSTCYPLVSITYHNLRYKSVLGMSSSLYPYLKVEP